MDSGISQNSVAFRGSTNQGVENSKLQGLSSSFLENPVILTLHCLPSPPNPGLSHVGLSGPAPQARSRQFWPPCERMLKPLHSLSRAIHLDGPWKRCGRSDQGTMAECAGARRSANQRFRVPVAGWGACWALSPLTRPGRKASGQLLSSPKTSSRLGVKPQLPGGYFRSIYSKPHHDTYIFCS